MRFGLVRLGLALVAAALVGQEAWAALTGEGWFTDSDYSTSGRIAQAALAVGLGIIFFATFRVMQRTDKMLAETKARRRAVEDGEPPTIDYSEGN